MARILAIDDSEVFRIQIREILSDHEILEAVDGLDGLDKLRSSGHIDLIICDLNMPNLDGIGFCQKKYENKAFSEIPIIMITTESNVEMKKIAKGLGVRAWVLKPIDPMSLVNGVRALLEKINSKAG